MAAARDLILWVTPSTTEREKGDSWFVFFPTGWNAAGEAKGFCDGPYAET